MLSAAGYGQLHITVLLLSVSFKGNFFLILKTVFRNVSSVDVDFKERRKASKQSTLQ